MKLSLVSSFLTLLASGIAFSTAPENYVTYDGYRVFRVSTKGQRASVLDKLSSLSCDEWSHDSPGHVDLVIAPDQLPAFHALNLEHKILHDDLGASIAAESAKSLSWKRQAGNSSWFDSYHPYADHQQYWKDLQASFSNNSELFSAGTSYEGRDLFALHLWGAGGPGKPAVIYHGNVHAREWISSMVVEYLTTNLINTYATDDLTRSILDKYDFYIVPFVNPDGFVYTQTTNRLWRKNRQPPPASKANSSCFGRDINRNWPYKWDGNPLGASDDPCDETYHGEAPSDSPENQGVVALVDQLRDSSGIKLYVDFHSYGQLIEYPFGYNCTLLPDDAGRFSKLGVLTSDAIYDVEGTLFIFGPACSILYATEGGGRDHTYIVGEAKWSYTIELRDRGNFGFVLPPDQIRGSGEEQWQGQRTMLSLLDEVFFDGEGPA